MTLTCKLGRPHVFDLKGQGKNVRQLDLTTANYRFYQTYFHFPELLLEPGVTISIYC